MVNVYPQFLNRIVFSHCVVQALGIHLKILIGCRLSLLISSSETVFLRKPHTFKRNVTIVLSKFQTLNRLLSSTGGFIVLDGYCLVIICNASCFFTCLMSNYISNYLPQDITAAIWMVFVEVIYKD